jgi:hypothetical protein
MEPRVCELREINPCDPRFPKNQSYAGINQRSENLSLGTREQREKSSGPYGPRIEKHAGHGQ